MTRSWLHWCPSGKCGKRMVYYGRIWMNSNDKKKTPVYLCKKCKLVFMKEDKEFINVEETIWEQQIKVI